MQYLGELLNVLSNLKEQTLLQQTKDEIIPLCIQYLGKDYELTKALLAAGTEKSPDVIHKNF